MATVLVGSHDDGISSGIKRNLRKHDVTIVSNLRDMLGNINTQNYDYYIMDVNLDFHSQFTIEPAKTVAKIVGKSHLLGIAGNNDLAIEAINSGINTIVKYYNFTSNIKAFVR